MPFMLLRYWRHSLMQALAAAGASRKDKKFAGDEISLHFCT